MKRCIFLGLLGMCLVSNSVAQDGGKTMQTISKLESRASIIIKQSEYKNYFTGDVRVDFLYPAINAKTHMGSYVTFEPSARTIWHTHPVGQHLIVTSGVGYYQAWGEPLQVIKAGDVVWIPIGVKHWHGASKEIAMTHLAITGIDENGKNVEWLEPVSDEQYSKK